jgi:hypothetical protein
MDEGDSIGKAGDTIRVEVVEEIPYLTDALFRASF